MTITIIVPLSTGLSAATACVEALAGLPDDPAHEVVIVDDASADLGDLCASLAGDVEIVRRDHPEGLAAAVRAGLERAADGIVVLVTGMGEVKGDWLGPLATGLADSAVSAVTSAVHGAEASHPVTAPAVAWRTADLRDVPDVPDAMVIAAICAELARVGRVEQASASTVAPASRRRVSARTDVGYGRAPELSIVIPTLDATTDRVRACIAGIQAHTDVAHEIIIVDNGAPPQGFASPVNGGIRAARGRYIVVCNDDVAVLPGWWPPLRRAVDDGAAVAFPLTIDGMMREDFAAWCFAMSRDTVTRHGVEPGEFFDTSMVVWFQDTDLLVRLMKAGNPPRLVRESTIRHGLSETVQSDDPALRAWIAVQVQSDQKAFERKHNVVFENGVMRAA